MKVILIWMAGNVEEVLVVSNVEVNATVAAIEAENAKLEEAERIDRVEVKNADSLAGVLDYIANP